MKIAYIKQKLIDLREMHFNQKIGKLPFFNRKIKKINDYYVKQDKDYAIGNFVMCTPSIMALSNYFGQKINVHFQSAAVKDIYVGSEYIKIIERPGKHKLLFSTALVNKEKPDYIYIWEMVARRFRLPLSALPHKTHVPKRPVPDFLTDKKYAVIVRGGNHNRSSEWLSKKDVGAKVYKSIIFDLLSRDYHIVHVGCAADLKKFINPLKPQHATLIIDDIQKSVGALCGAALIISNDTGMYHVSAALGRPVFVMWKSTPFLKNISPSRTIKYSFVPNHLDDYKKWISDFA